MIENYNYCPMSIQPPETLTMNATTTSNSPCLMDSKCVSCNDIITVSNKNDGFRLGKVTDIEENMINITLFNYKLDIKTEMVTDEDIILNFGPHQSKSIFEMSNEHQRTLLNRIYERVAISASLLSSTKQMEVKQALATMEAKFAQLLDQLFLFDDYPRRIEQIVDDEIINYGEAISLIFNRAQKSSYATQLDLLARLVAEICWKKQSLELIEHRMNPNREESDQTFLNRCCFEIGYLITSCTNNGGNADFTNHYLRLAMRSFEFQSGKLT